MKRTLKAYTESWPLREVFRISRGARTHAEVVVVEIACGDRVGRGECTPYARYGESADSVLRQIESATDAIVHGATPADQSTLLPAGAARNALDCALWDLLARQACRPVWALCGLPEPVPQPTAYTLSLGTTAAMATAARAHLWRPLLKIKLDRDDPIEKLRAIREAAPRARLIVDANDAWQAHDLPLWLPALPELGVVLLEQPLPAHDDDALAAIDHAVPIVADESCHVAVDIDRLRGKYDGINIKLDKCGGLTEALATRIRARAAGLSVMIGSMGCTSLAIAPAMLLAPGADVLDLDPPLWLARDRDGGGRQASGGRLCPPEPRLWGGGVA